MRLNERVAQELHDFRREADEEHDQISCWCCCIDCDFNFLEVTSASEEPPSTGQGIGFPV